MRALPAVALLAAGACALSIEGTVRGAPRAPGSSFAGAANEAAGLRVTLNGGERSTVTRADGRFGFDGLAPGVYLVEIAPAPLPARGGGYATGNGGPEHAWVYSTYKVQLSEGAPAGSSSGAAAAAGGVQVLEYRYPGAPKLPAAYPIDAVPVARGSFFEERPRTSVLGLLKNPTVIMMLVMAFMALGMPALMKQMDPEALREMQEQQAAMGGGDPMAMLGNLLGGGSSSAPAPAPARGGTTASGSTGAARRPPPAGGR